MTSIPTQPFPPHIEEAAHTLSAILVAPIDVEARLAVAASLAVLCDVHPPYPPLAHRRALPLDEGLVLARTQLAAAAEASTDVSESLRIGLAARELGLPP